MSVDAEGSGKPSERWLVQGADGSCEGDLGRCALRSSPKTKSAVLLCVGLNFQRLDLLELYRPKARPAHAVLRQRKVQVLFLMQTTQEAATRATDR